MEPIAVTVAYSVVIPAWNEEKLLPRTLTHLTAAMASQASPGEIIVVDNNSDDGTAAIARQGGARVVFEPENNIAQARNAGARAAGGAILIFVDADTLMSAALLGELLRRMASGQYYAGGAAMRFDAAAPWFARRMTALWNRLAPRRCWAAGCCIYVLKSWFDAVGGFPAERYAAEELALCAALRKRNRKHRLKFSFIAAFPVVSSARKLSGRAAVRMFAQMFLIGLCPSLCRRKAACSSWYKR